MARKDKLWSFYTFPSRPDHVRWYAEINYGHFAPCVNQEERIRQYQDVVSVLITFKLFAGAAGREIHRPNGVSLE